VPTPIRLIDVSPRDGLQNETGVIATADKATLCRMVLAAGVHEVEATSFVSAKWVPQLGDAADLLAILARDVNRFELHLARPMNAGGQCLSVLVPNEKGMEAALEANRAALAAHGRRIIDKVSVFTSASETFSRKNTNASIEETLTRFVPVIAAARREELRVRGYVSCAIACPFEGETPAEAAPRVAARLLELGVDEISLADTIGAGTRESMARLLGAAKVAMGSFEQRGLLPLNLHLHDTFGRAAECVREALGAGVGSFDASVAGLGGCPYASTPGNRAPGNIDMELLVRTVEEAGFSTCIDKAALAKAAAFARGVVAASRMRDAADGASATGAAQ
jgi:hydroxymethylglutaryl-CoA lyase